MTTPAPGRAEDGAAPALELPASDFYEEAGPAYERGYGAHAGLLGAVGRYAARLGAGGAVLDLGSGTGRPVAAALAARGFRVHGVDVAAAQVERARRAVPAATFERGDVRTWAPPPPPAGGPRFAGLVAARCLFELARADAEALVARWPAWLAPGAPVLLAAIGADDLPGVRGAMYDADGRFARGVPFRFMGRDVLCHAFTRAGWVALLEDNGFVVDEVWTEHFHPPDFVDSEDETDLFIIARKPE